MKFLESLYKFFGLSPKNQPAETIRGSQQPSESLFQSLVEPIKHFWGRLFPQRDESGKAENLTKSQPAEKLTTSPNIENDNPIINIFEEDVPFELKENELALAPGLNATIKRRGKDFRIIGFNDGVKGIYNEKIEYVAQAEANSIVQYIMQYAKGQLEALKSAVDVLTKLKEDEERRYEEAKNHLEDLTYAYNKNPKQFSMDLAYLYVLFAVALIVADIPMANSLTRKGFNLTGDFTLLLVIGLSLCAIYIKIYYDDYISTPLGYYISQFKKISGIRGFSYLENKDINQPDSNESKENEKKELLYTRIEFWVKFLTKTAILIFTFHTIIKLGQFRYLYIDDAERKLLDEYVKWVVDKLGYDSKMTYESAYNITKTAFICITLIFPLIGGVCLSLGLSNFENIKRYKEAQSDCDKKRDSFIEVAKNFDKKNQHYEDYCTIYKEWEGAENGKNEKVHHYQNVFYAYYSVGYKHGFQSPDYFDKNADLFTQIENMRRKLIARRVYKILNNEKI